MNALRHRPRPVERGKFRGQKFSGAQCFHGGDGYAPALAQPVQMRALSLPLHIRAIFLFLQYVLYGHIPGQHVKRRIHAEHQQFHHACFHNLRGCPRIM
ncbi:hypothetical protein SDC9_198261 [bioreactor metagenome]|uniref:Uncharacterized protein n=1 Tax=bioreactor metagenome TaxID=1076179 RepID=A0A645IJH5_9ZZZZ